MYASFRVHSPAAAHRAHCSSSSRHLCDWQTKHDSRHEARMKPGLVLHSPFSAQCRQSSCSSRHGSPGVAPPAASTDQTSSPKIGHSIIANAATAHMSASRRTPRTPRRPTCQLRVGLCGGMTCIHPSWHHGAHTSGLFAWMCRCVVKVVHSKEAGLERRRSRQAWMPTARRQPVPHRRPCARAPSHLLGQR